MVAPIKEGLERKCKAELESCFVNYYIIFGI